MNGPWTHAAIVKANRRRGFRLRSWKELWDRFQSGYPVERMVQAVRAREFYDKLVAGRGESGADPGEVPLREAVIKVVDAYQAAQQTLQRAYIAAVPEGYHVAWQVLDRRTAAEGPHVDLIREIRALTFTGPRYLDKAERRAQIRVLCWIKRTVLDGGDAALRAAWEGPRDR